MQDTFSEKKFEPEIAPVSDCKLTLEGREGKLRHIAIGGQIFEVWEDNFSDKMRVLI